MVRDGILTSAAGKVTLLSPANMPQDYDVLADDRVDAMVATVGKGELVCRRR